MDNRKKAVVYLLPFVIALAARLQNSAGVFSLMLSKHFNNPVLLYPASIYKLVFLSSPKNFLRCHKTVTYELLYVFFES